MICGCRGLVKDTQAVIWVLSSLSYIQKHLSCAVTYQQHPHLVELSAWDVQGLPLLPKPAPRQSYFPTAGKPVPSRAVRLKAQSKG